jgi:quercetin dioxygenase-like cupin family protein
VDSLKDIKFYNLPLEDQAVIVDTQTADGIFIKQITVPKKDSWAPQHAHVWDHSTLLTSGSMFVWKDGVLDRQYKAPAVIFIPAGVKHLFRTLEDNTVFFCIHNLHSEQAISVLEEHQIVDEVT